MIEYKRNIRIVGAAIAVAVLLAASTASAAWSPSFRGRWQSFRRNLDGQVRINVLYRDDRAPGTYVRGRLAERFLGGVRQALERVPAMTLEVSEWDLDRTLADLSADPDVLAAEPDHEAFAVGQSLPWGVDRLGAQISHAGGFTGEGVRVAVIDTGIWLDPATRRVHPDLRARYRGGYDFVNGDRYPWDDHGHGTHVAGTIAATDNTLGVVGVAPRVTLFALKVLDRYGSGYYSDIAAAIDWSIRKGIRVVNMSLGGLYDSAFLESACDRARAAGITLVAAAGNTYGPGLLYPAAYDSVLSVSNTTSSNVLNPSSTYGPGLDFAAPGTSIYSTAIGGYMNMTGTSMASPHVAGAAALIVGRGITDPDMVEGYLIATATDLGAPGRDDLYGHGLVNTAAPLPETVTISAPLDGEIVPAGAEYIADWEPVAGAGSYRATGTCDGGRTWFDIAIGTTATAAGWTVPVFPRDNRTCRVQVAALATDGALLALDQTGDFTVAQVVIEAPAAGETLTAGEDYLVRWSLHGTLRTPARIKLVYRKGWWRRIALLPPDATSFPWKVLPERRFRADRRLRVVVLDGRGRVLARDTVIFAVTPPPSP